MKKQSEMIPVIRPYLPAQERFMHYAGTIWERRWLTNGGPLVSQLQTRLKERLQIPGLVAIVVFQRKKRR